MDNEKQRQYERFKREYDKAVRVSNNIDLKTEMKKNSLVIISTDEKLYENLLKKFPKAKISKGAKKTGKFLTFAGVLISVLSAGFLSFVGIPMAGVGVVLGAAGLVLDDYEDYRVFINYDNKEIIFVKVKGVPRMELPKNFSIK